MDGCSPARHARILHGRVVILLSCGVAAGYEYCLKWDDDSFINAPVQYNMVKFMREKKIEFAYHHTIFDAFGYLAGLAEMTRWVLPRDAARSHAMTCHACHASSTCPHTLAVWRAAQRSCMQVDGWVAKGDHV